MATTLSISTAETIGLDEFRKRVLQKVDPDDPDTLLNAGHDMVALANNDKLLLEHIRSDLANWKADQISMYTPQCCLLDSFGRFKVRINLWKSSGMTEAEMDFFSYTSYHNHDFSFLTTNYYGPGYRTRIYQASAPWRSVMPGSAVEMDFLEEAILSPGKVMYYRKDIDVHSQIPPQQDSASINLLLDNDDDATGSQFYFDAAEKRIIGRVENNLSKRLTLLDFGYALAGAQSLEALHAIAENHPCGITRGKAAEIIEALQAKGREA
ncbi:hypothetical protein ASG87_09600 [Frateuria sp. Soil773]|uniref:hypothetical protein n=1 Tax=Frateuria sp. Soil773 TaxID=1736407 RepID=UPI0006F6B8E0|nr:hypothetical protein [Frateuria sp. Soil773]KRE88812.1 hypothetical protein ASG87_09600 [Frateuria sp. Soil773]